MASKDVDEIGGSGRLGLDKNLGPPQHDFNNFQSCLWKYLFLLVFLVLLGLRGGPWGHRFTAWPPRICMILVEAVERVWVGI